MNRVVGRARDTLATEEFSQSDHSGSTNRDPGDVEQRFSKSDRWAGFRLDDPWTGKLTEGTLRGVWWKLFEGDSRKLVSLLPAESVNCIVTSPPYFWQRDYEVGGQIGLEPSIDAYVQNIRSVFSGLKRVLKPDGTVFLNLGDTYYSAKGEPHGPDD